MPDHPDLEKIPLEIDGIAVRETLREFFLDPKNGTPDDISPAGCLALAQKSNQVGGKKGFVLWNAWRTAFPATGSFRSNENPVKNKVQFSKINFCSPENAVTSFAGFQFGNFADFSGSQFGYFSQFQGAQFGEYADFQGAQFDFAVKFQGAQFGKSAQFQGAQFDGKVDFSAASWETIQVYFVDTTRFLTFKKEAQESGLSPDTFQSINFAGATFFGEVDFANRKFLNSTRFGLLPNDFKRQSVKRDEQGKALFDGKGKIIFDPDQQQHRHTTFHRAPRFHGCELHQDTSFEGAVFLKPTGCEVAARAYRTLKLAFSKQQAVREEQQFFRLEMMEETAAYAANAKKTLHAFFLIPQGPNALIEIGKKAPRQLLQTVALAFTWFLYKLYAWVSDYGFSVFRPLLLLAVAWLVFAQIYASYSDTVTLCWPYQAGCEWQTNWLMYSAQQALPLPGLDKLGHAIKDVAMGWLILHKTISIAFLFLIGLALRNLFKLK